MTANPRLELRSVSRRFGATQAAENVSFRVGAGEIVGLVGHNGAGKSTISKIIAGSDRGYSGAMTLDGRQLRFRSPTDAMTHGISLVPQRLTVVDSLTVRQNMTLGQGGLTRGKKSVDEEVDDVAEKLGLADLLNVRAGSLGPSVQRVVMVARALVRRPRLLILDEPTAALSKDEVDRLFGVFRGLRGGGLSMIFVSHRLEEVLELSDRIVAMARGAVIADRSAEGVSKAELVDLIAGRHVDVLDPHGQSAVAPQPSGQGLELNDVAIAPDLRGLNLFVNPGEIVGLTGLVGSGRTGLLDALWGVGNELTGSVRVNGASFDPSTPRHAMQAGVAYLPENRARRSLFGRMTAVENVTLPYVRRFRRRFVRALDRGREYAAAQELLSTLSVEPPDAASQRVTSLSGGNQQKCLVARWLLPGLDVYLLDEPTEGVDVSGRQEIYEAMGALARAGKAVLVSSSDVEEVVERCSRVYVIANHTIATELSGSDMTVERVNRACIT